MPGGNHLASLLDRNGISSPLLIGACIMIAQSPLCLRRPAAVALAMALSLSTAQAAWHGGGGGWHGGGGWGWRGGGWGPGVAFGLALPPLYYAPPPAYYYPPPAFYPGSAYYLPPAAYYRPPYRYGYAPGYYGSYNAYPGYGMSMSLNPNNCGTPDEPKPCTR
jgi:hypothetical protein